VVTSTYNIAKMVDGLGTGTGIGVIGVDSVQGKWAAGKEGIMSSVFIRGPSAIKSQAGKML
jgi:hypothetical protein